MPKQINLVIVGKGIRCGMGGVYHSCCSKADNYLCEYINDDRPKTWLILLHDNNFYGGVICENPLYRTNTDVNKSFEEVLPTRNNSAHGYFVVVDLEYASYLNHKHTGYPLVPDHLELTELCYHRGN